MYSYIFVRRFTNMGWHCQDGDEYGVMRDKADTVRLSSLSAKFTARYLVTAFTMNTPVQSSATHFS